MMSEARYVRRGERGEVRRKNLYCNCLLFVENLHVQYVVSKISFAVSFRPTVFIFLLTYLP